MCGLVGMFDDRGGIAEHLDLLPGLIGLMARRGPDDDGSWTDGRHVAFGFRRLAILDPTPAGHQPMVSDDGRHALVFNGEVYNFRELRRRLQAEGARFRSASDTEVVLVALATWGVSALSLFNGMFALAWYDTHAQALVLARDPVGIKPLHYLLHRRGVVFGSQYDQLLRHPACNRAAIRPDVLGLYLRFGYLPPPYGLVDGTFQLEPGTYLLARPGARPEVHRFRGLPDTSPPYLTGHDAEEAVAEAVSGAVRRQSVSDVGVGVFLSGGIDSPLVAANLQAASETPLPAFTIGSTHPRLDETAAAAAYARHIGVDHHLRVFDTSHLLSSIDDLASAYSEPFADSSALPTMLVSATARSEVKVALSGDGGDEVFWGYPRFRSALRIGRWLAFPRPVRRLLYAAGRCRPGRPPAAGLLAESFGTWYRDAHSALRTADLDRLCPDASLLPPDFDLYDLRSVPDEVGLAQWLRTTELRGHLQAMLLKVDRASMFHGLEVRAPLLDLDLLDLAARLHPSTCLSPTTGKIVLRTALGRQVPPALVTAGKRGFEVPVGTWLRAELAPRVRALLLERDPFPEGLFDRAVVRQLVEDHLDRGVDRTRALWYLFALQLWADAHLRAPTLARAGS